MPAIKDSQKLQAGAFAKGETRKCVEINLDIRINNGKDSIMRIGCCYFASTFHIGISELSLNSCFLGEKKFHTFLHAHI